MFTYISVFLTGIVCVAYVCTVSDVWCGVWYVGYKGCIWQKQHVLRVLMQSCSKP